MAERFQFSDLLIISGVMGAARWKPTHLGPTVSPPQLVEFGGNLTRDRAERMMAHAEAGGLAIYGIGQLSYHRAPVDKTVVYPIDAFYAHGQYTSVIATMNRVAVLLDNTQKVDVQELAGKMIRVDN
ncbi:MULTISPECIES: hypothetical protein [unclassified Sphingobium]|uniref:hypothetical protein n=1 Tax=unclassified Sphingobium TaxID=2611147 RepID=UPI000BB56CBB|nr:MULTISPECIES: hypothetical protein [unclassified Sphingobium]MBV2148246.1 hypothetical protein [Sphingobium sp. AS12]PBN41586.1 hypothetical protein SxD43FB_20935 [Sphingobium sp. D43FB]